MRCNSADHASSASWNGFSSGVYGNCLFAILLCLNWLQSVSVQSSNASSFLSHCGFVFLDGDKLVEHTLPIEPRRIRLLDRCKNRLASVVVGARCAFALMFWQFSLECGS